MEAVPPPRPSGRHPNHLGIAYIMAPVLILVIGMIGEVALWALLYYSWGDLGSFTNSVYVSLASFRQAAWLDGRGTQQAARVCADGLPDVR